MEERKELLNSYKNLSIGNKRKELGREIAELTVITQKLLMDLNPTYPNKDIKEYNNLFDESVSEEDYLNGLYEDILDLSENIINYCNFSTGLYYGEDNSSE